MTPPETLQLVGNVKFITRKGVAYSGGWSTVSPRRSQPEVTSRNDTPAPAVSLVQRPLISLGRVAQRSTAASRVPLACDRRQAGG